MIRFFSRCMRSQLSGPPAYWTWVVSLTVLSLVGLHAWARQLALGLYTTGMGDEVSWGLYIANFTFLVGMAAAAVILVIPAYVFKDRQIHRMVIFAELFAVAALVMCILFITVDVGRPDRAWHIIPDLGIFNWPSSLPTWDVIVLNVYLGLNLYVCAYVLLQKYRKKEPVSWLYLPVVFLAIAWAPSIHTVTAFLFQGLAARPCGTRRSLHRASLPRPLPPARPLCCWFSCSWTGTGFLNWKRWWKPGCGGSSRSVFLSIFFSPGVNFSPNCIRAVPTMSPFSISSSDSTGAWDWCPGSGPR